MNFGVGRRHSLDLALLWLWCRLAAAALIRPPAWEPLYASCVALKKTMMSILTTSIQYNTGSINKVNQTRKEIEISHCGTVEMNLTRNHEVGGSIPGLAPWVKDPALP